MSELINTHDNRATIRWKLLTGASALALMAYVSNTSVAKSEDADRPTIWIDLGAQTEMMQGTSSPFTAPFMLQTPTPNTFKTDSPIDDQRPSRFAFGGDGKISFQPENSDWVFSASINYGRSHGNRHVHHETTTTPTFPHHSCICNVNAYEDMTNAYNEHHSIVDFSVGKDVGLGVFGHDGTSEIDAGARVVDLAEDSSFTGYARPNVTYSTIFFGYIAVPNFYVYEIHAQAQRSFHGVGPSLSWEASAGLAGNKDDGELMLDWGINGAMLFGRQRSKTHHDTKAQHYYHSLQPYYSYYRTIQTYKPLYHHSRNSVRSRRVTVPDVGGFIGLSWKSQNSKVSFGYRGEIMFKAMDTGIDATKKSNLTFNGPFASISIGIGD